MAVENSILKSKQLLSVKQAALILGVSKQTIFRLTRNRILPYYTISNHYRFDLSDVLSYKRKKEAEALQKRNQS